MGAKRKVDAKLYAKIKKELKTPQDDKKVMKKYELGQTTVRAIRNSINYTHFVIKTGDKKPTTRKNKTKKTMTSQEQAQMAWTGFMLLALIAGFIVVLILIRWVLSWFGI